MNQVSMSQTTYQKLSGLIPQKTIQTTHNHMRYVRKKQKHMSDKIATQEQDENTPITSRLFSSMHSVW